MSLEAIGLGLSAADTLVGNTINAVQNYKNMQLQQATLDWQKQAQQTTWDREDSAVQRRVKDLQNAGLSVTLAAGSGASASQPLTPITPQSNFEYRAGLADALNNAINTARQVVDIDNVNAATAKLQQERSESEARTLNFSLDSLMKQNELDLFDVRKLKLEREVAAQEASTAKTRTEKEFLQKKVDSYDLEIQRQQLANKKIEQENAQFLRDFMIQQASGLSSKDLGTKGPFVEFMKRVNAMLPAVQPVQPKPVQPKADKNKKGMSQSMSRARASRK